MYVWRFLFLIKFKRLIDYDIIYELLMLNVLYVIRILIKNIIKVIWINNDILRVEECISLKKIK